MTKRDPFDDLIQKLEKLPLPMAPDPFDPWAFVDDLIRKAEKPPAAPTPPSPPKPVQQPPTP